MESKENRSYGWTYAIAGTACLLGGMVMFFDVAASRTYLVTLIVGPIMLLRGIFLLRRGNVSSPNAQPSSNLFKEKPAEAGDMAQNDSSSTPAPIGQANVEPAWLKEAFSVHPLPPVAVLPTLALAPTETEPSERKQTAPSAQEFFHHGLWGYVLPSTFFLGVLVLIAYIAPELISSWRIAEARGEAEAAYQRRKKELRAEAEHAEEMLDKLDRRVNLISLGFRAVVQKVTPMVVSVSNLSEHHDRLARPIPVYDPVQDKRFWQMSVGSGFIAKPGFILTNHHVVNGADQLRITFASGHAIFVPRSAVSSDAVMDLAVIRMPECDEMKTALEFADSDKDVHVGDWSLTIGSPMGLKHTFTHGVISAKGRLTNWLPAELLQTDAAINPGNSGGPLLDQHGRVVGVNVALASENGRNQGIGFAIPSNAARKILERLITEGRIPRGYLGVRLKDLIGPDLPELGKQDTGGVVIAEVEPGSPARRGGLREGDIVVRFNNEALARNESGKHLRQLVSSLDPGVEATLEVLRGRQRLSISVVLGKRPDNLP